MQSSTLAPSVTPRPVKHPITTHSGVGHRNGSGAGGSRMGRTYTPSVSPIKSPRVGHAHPFVEASAKCTSGRPPESTTGSTSGTGTSPRLRKKPLILSGDIRNLDSNFELSMSHVAATLEDVGSAFRRHGITVSRDSAAILLHEYEENNDQMLGYAAFVDDLARVLRETARNKAGSARLHTKKLRLVEHYRQLETAHAQRVRAVQMLLRDSLRVPWGRVRDAFHRVDTANTGRVAKHTFTQICTQLEVPVTAALVDALLLPGSGSGSGTRSGSAPASEEDGEIDYYEFLATFGDAFQHGDTNTVAVSLVYKRPELELDPALVGSDATPVSNTLQSPGVSHALHATKGGSSPQPHPPRGGGGAAAAYVTGAEALREALLDAQRPPPSDSHQHEQQENSSLIFSGHGHGHDSANSVHKDRAALSSPGHALKDAFSRLRDAQWRAIFVECEASDPKHTGLVPVAELLRVLAQYLGELPQTHFAALFRACGSHAHQLLSYRQLVSSYRASVMDSVAYFQQDEHDNTARAVKQHAPSESLVQVWAIRVQRAQMTATQWRALQDELWRADGRRQGRVTRALFVAAVTRHMALRSDQAAFLCVFYEDATLSGDDVWVRYGSFLTDYEDSGLEDEAFSPHQNKPEHARSPERKARVRPPGYGIHNSHTTTGGGHVSSTRTGAAVGVGAGVGVGSGRQGPTEEEAEETRLRTWLTANVAALEQLVRAADRDQRGYLALSTFTTMCRELLKEATGSALGGASSATSPSQWREATMRAFTSLTSKYVAQSQFYYRGFLLDLDARAGLQTQALVLQDDGDYDEDCAGDGPCGGDGGDSDDDEGGDTVDRDGRALPRAMDVHEAREALRHHLRVSRSRQKVVYTLLQRLDPGRQGLVGYPELRRALETLAIPVSDAVARELCAGYEDEDEATGASLGRVKYLLLLYALGGRDPDKMDGMSDLSSHCSYYSAISISPRAVKRGPAPGQRLAARATTNRDHVVAALAVSNAIDRPRAANAVGNSAIGGAAAAAAVERKVKMQLEAQGRTKWKQLARAFQQVDSDRRGDVSAASFRKVLEDIGVRLEQDEVVRLQLKYDVQQTGRVHYHEYLRNLTNAMSELAPSSSPPRLAGELQNACAVAGGESGSGGGDGLLPTISSTSPQVSPRKPVAMTAAASVGSGIPDALRAGVAGKWKAIYASFKSMDKGCVGRVSSAHFRQLLEWYALAVTDDMFLALLRRFDHAEDGLVDYNKFMRACIA